MMWYLAYYPHEHKSRRYIEVFNETMFMFICYIMVTFSGFNGDSESKMVMGYVFVAIFMLMLLVNLAQV